VVLPAIEFKSILSPEAWAEVHIRVGPESPAGRTILSNRIHLIFSTKGREKRIPEGLQEKLWPYMAGVAQSWILSKQGWWGSGSCPRITTLTANDSVGEDGADSQVMLIKVAQ
jgi:hypothetical protein